MKAKFASLPSGIFKSPCHLFVWNRINEMVTSHEAKNKVLDLKTITVSRPSAIPCTTKNNENLSGKSTTEQKKANTHARREKTKKKKDINFFHVPFAAWAKTSRMLMSWTTPAKVVDLCAIASHFRYEHTHRLWNTFTRVFICRLHAGIGNLFSHQTCLLIWHLDRKLYWIRKWSLLPTPAEQNKAAAGK